LAGGHAPGKTGTPLFYVDKQKANVPIPAAERKAKARTKILHVEKRLNPYPHMPTAVARQQKRKRCAEVDNRKLKRRKKLEKTQQDSDKKNEAFDLWAPAEDPLDRVVEKYPEIDKEYLIPLKQSIKPPNKRIPSLAPAVELPKEGTSYNPAFGAHQALLKEAVEEQLKKRKELNETMARLKAEQKRDWKPDAETDPLFTEKGNEEEKNNADSSDEDDGIPEHVFNLHIPRKLTAERNKADRKKKKKKGKKEKKGKKKKMEKKRKKKPVRNDG